MTADQSILFVSLCCAAPLIIPGILMIFRVAGVAPLVGMVMAFIFFLMDVSSGSTSDHNSGPLDLNERAGRWVGVIMVLLGIAAFIFLPDIFVEP